MPSETIEVVETKNYVCPMCKTHYDDEKRAARCLSFGQTGKDAYDLLKDRHGDVVYFNNGHWCLIDKVFINTKGRCDFYVSAADSNDMYHTDWFVKPWVVCSIEEAVDKGWRPFFLGIMQRHEDLWFRYKLAMHKVPHEILFEEAIKFIVGRSPVGD